jgi:hypothetical protein
MKHVQSLMLASLAGTVLAGCSTVRSHAVDPTKPDAAVGLVYYLPVRSFEVDAKFVVQDCIVLQSGVATLSYEVVPTVRSVLSSDRRRPFAIYDGLHGNALKALNFEISQYENGTLKAVNAVIDDRSAETATNVASGALKFALGLTGVGLFSGSSIANRPIASLALLDENNRTEMLNMLNAACGKKTIDALQAVRALAGRLDAAADSASAKAAAAAKVASAEKAVTDARAGLKAAQETKGTEDLQLAERTLAAAVAELSSARDALKNLPAAQPPSALAQQMAAIIQRDLTYTVTKAFTPPENPSAIEEPITYSADRLQALGINVAEGADLKALVNVRLEAPSGGTGDPSPVAQLVAPGTRSEGIWTRLPAMARLKVCVESCSDETVRLSQLYSVPQWGHLARIPLKGMAFAKTSTKLSFAPDGGIVSLYFDSTAPAERASKAFADIGGSFSDFVTARAKLLTELAAADTAAEKAEIQKEIDVLNLRTELANAQTDQTTDQSRQIADLDFQIKVAQKARELLEERRKLEAAQNGATVEP